MKNILILLLIVFVPLFANGQTIPEGLDYATITHNDPWDMSNEEDIYPLHWVHNLSSIKFENGVLTAIPKDNDPHIWLQFPQIPSSIPTLDQRQQDIDADSYYKLSFYLWLPETISSSQRARIVWHSGGDTVEQFDLAYSGSKLFPVQSGWHLYEINLKTIALSNGQAWSGIQQGIRIDPCVGGCDSFKLDWVRLTAPELSANAVLSDISTNAVLIDDDNDSSNGFISSVDSSTNYNLSHLPADEYYLAPVSDNDYALAVRLDSWDMSDEGDILFDLLNDWQNPTISTGVFSATTNGPDPNVMLNVPDNKPIDADSYKYLNVTMSLSRMPSQESGLLIYWGSVTNTPVSHTGFISTSAGKKTYTIDLSQYSSWNGDIRTLRIDPLNGPSAGSGVSVTIDEVSLSKTKSSANATVSYLDEKLIINSTPKVSINKPGLLDGQDYAETVLNNPWLMDSSNDVAEQQNLTGSGFTQSISDLNLSGDFFKATSIARQPEGDPGVWLLFQELTNAIQADSYHILSFNLYVPFDKNEQQELTDGAVVRVAWKQNDFDTGVTSDDILMMPGMHQYVLDMKKIRYEPASSRIWSGLIQYFRIDPLEFPTAREFYLDSVKLLSLSSYSYFLPVDVFIEDANDAMVKVDIIIDDAIIKSYENISTGEQQFTIDISGLSAAEHNLKVQVSDAYNSSYTSAIVPFLKKGNLSTLNLINNQIFYDLNARVLHIPHIKVQGVGDFSINMNMIDEQKLEFKVSEINTFTNSAAIDSVNFDFEKGQLFLDNVKLMDSTGITTTHQVQMELISPTNTTYIFRVISIQ